MKLKTLSLVLFSLLAVAARGELLYFQADAFAWTGWKLFDYVQVGVAMDGEEVWDGSGQKTYLQIRSTSEATETYDFLLSDNNERLTATGFADVTGYLDDIYTFYIEAYTFGAGGADKLIWGYSEDTTKSYDELTKAGHTFAGGIAPQYLTPWIVPEPTSALLLLLGAAGLALRRKRA